jgi:hypothetical protein
MRFRVEPRDVPPEYAARRLGLKYPDEFEKKLPNLIARGFPPADTAAKMKARAAAKRTEPNQ